MDVTYKMEVYGHPIKETQDILLGSVLYTEVIEGLNGYFASEPRNYYITIRRQIDGGTFFLYDPEKWVDILISWLRTKHEIFYYPGMEAKYAKTERIPPLNERLMDEGALNSLKKLHKRVTGEEPEVDSHTLIADGISHVVSVKDAKIEELKTHIENQKPKETIGKQMVDDYEKDLLRFIYKTYADRTRLGDETITYNPPNICNTITKIISDYAISRNRIDTLERRIKHIYDTYKTTFTVDDYVLNGDPSYYFMLDCIGSWVGSSSELKHECDFLKDELGKEAVIREFLDRRRKTRTKLGTIEKKLEDILKDVKEELP